MPYADIEKQRKANRESLRRARERKKAEESENQIEKSSFNLDCAKFRHQMFYKDEPRDSVFCDQHLRECKACQEWVKGMNEYVKRDNRPIEGANFWEGSEVNKRPERFDMKTEGDFMSEFLNNTELSGTLTHDKNRVASIGSTQSKASQKERTHRHEERRRLFE